MLARGLLRARLEVGASSAPLERDAEQTALRVMRMRAGGGCCASCAGGGSCEGETAKLHRAPAGATAPAAVLSPAAEREVRRITRGGDALPSAVRAGFEPRFGADLSGVRVHRDAEAATVARAIGARAFSLGNHIGFGTGQWAPGTPGGDHLIAHELAHTLQQGGAAPAGAGAVQRSLWDDVVDTVAEIGSDAVDAVEEAGEAAVEVAGDVVDTVAGAAQDVGEGLVEVAGQVVDTAEAIGEKASEIAQDVLDAVAEFGQEVVDVAAWVITLPGRLALRGANALAGLLGGSVEVGPDGLIINFPEIPLFDDWEQELVPPLPRKFIYLAAAGMQLGPVTLIGSIGIPISAPAIRVFLGPGRLQNIRVRIDPMASTYEAHGEIYVGAALNEWMQTGLAARVDAFTLLPTEPPLPVQASVEAGGLLTLQGSALGSISNAVTLSYTAGTIGFSLNPALELGVIMEADLHAYINAQLYDVELCEYLWPLEHWEASEAYRVNFPISLTSSGGKVAITLGPLGAEAIPVDDIETALQRFVPPSKGCKALEEIVAELCKRKILPPELCPETEEAGVAGNGPPTCAKAAKSISGNFKLEDSRKKEWKNDPKLTWPLDIYYKDRKHTKVADCPVAELNRALTFPPDQLTGELKKFVEACKAKDRSYGSQLGSEAYSSYASLMKGALTSSDPDDSFCTNSGMGFGMNLGGGGCKNTQFFRVHDDPPNNPSSAFHLFPVPSCG